MKISVRGLLLRGKTSTVTITVTTKAGQPIKGASVLLSGLGIGKRLTTNSAGAVRVKLRPRRAGNLIIQATRTGYWLSEYDAPVR
jgi:hypothetical protein